MADSGIDGQTSATLGAGIPAALPTPGRWEIFPELPLPQLDALAPDLTRLQVQVLANRGWRGDAARDFVRSSWPAQPPYLLGMDTAVARIRQASERGERVVVFGDFDVDGLTSCAVMLLALRAAGVRAEPHIPTRAAEGRGPTEAVVRALADDGVRLIVTTDCGTTNVAAVEAAKGRGIDFVITDHHLPQGPLAPSVALVNPQQPGCPCAAGQLVGVGVAFRVAEALLAQSEGAHEQVLEGLLDLVAIGTVGDVAPMTPENWALVHAGLRQLNTTPRPGLRALIERAGLRAGAVSERDISFALAPRLNAAGRMDNPMVALNLLLTEDARVASELAGELQQLNEARQRSTDLVVSAARAQVGRGSQRGEALLVVSGDDWPLGVIGLVASRLAEEYARPVVVTSLGDEECRGSIRGPVGLNLVEALAQRADLLRHFGGHAQAAGFTIARADLDTLTGHLRLAAQRARAAMATTGAAPADVSAAADAANTGVVAGIASDAPAALSGEVLPGEQPGADQRDAGEAGVVRIDCRLPLRRVAAETYQALRQLAPFGSGYPEPIFYAARVRIARAWRSGPEGRNLRLALRDGAEQRVGFWSRMGALQPALRDLTQVDIAYTIDQFSRSGVPPEYMLRIVALRPAQPGPSAPQQT